MAQSQLQLQNWHLKLTNLTNNFVIQTSKFFKHCRKVERQFSKTSRNLQDEKKRLAERESQINRIVASIESFLQVDIPIDELYTAVPEPGSDVDPFLSALTRRLSLGFDIDQIQQQNCQSQNHHKNLVILLQKENEQKSIEINSLLGQIEQSDAREKRLHRLAEKFTALATDFERILQSSADSFSGSDSGSCSSEINSRTEQNQEEIPIETEDEEDEETDAEDEENDENSWDDLMTAIEQATQNLQSYCDYRRNPVEIFQRNYVHFQETQFCAPFNEFLHLVESEFIRLWKNEDRREIYENARKIDVGSQTETESDKNSKRRQTEAREKETKISKTNDFLMQEKHLVENKLAHLSKLENSLQLRECELRLQETEFKRRVSEFSRDKTEWERKKKQAEAEIQIQIQSQLQIQIKENEKARGQNQHQTQLDQSILIPSARSSMSLNDLVESKLKDGRDSKLKNGVNSSSSTSILLTPPPDLRAASFDRCKRFPYFHLLRDRYEEISNCAKSSGLQSGFNRYHFYASRMNDILNYFTTGTGTGTGEFGERQSCQLSEQLESHKFVSVIKAHYGVQKDLPKNWTSTSCLASESEKIIAIGYGSTALEATEKAVQLTHDQLFNHKPEHGKQDGFSNCFLHPNVIKVKMKEKEKVQEDFNHIYHGCGDGPLININ